MQVDGECLCGFVSFEASVAPHSVEDAFPSLREGALHQRAALRPSAQWWTRSSQRWLDDFQTLPKIETQTRVPSVKHD